MGDASSLLRQLPRVDEILAHRRVVPLAEEAPRALALQAAREAIEEARSNILTGGRPPDVSADAVADRVAAILRRRSLRSLRRVVNAAGIVLHTGLGRAPLSAPVRQALADVAEGYCNVQASLESGQRTQREVHVEWLLNEITGAEATAVVNNNAAATVLVLNTLAADREVIVSRGEMVEIGGAFRIPEIMKLARCRLVEVGCTNRTHLRDYEQAITEQTGLILSVHQSNYRIQGFASQVAIGELAALAHTRNLPCAHDLGSGALLDLRRYGLPHEPSVPESLAAGADVAFFSGDKLLGGPQCGIILGGTKSIQAMRKNPIYRIFRVGKLTLAALEATLRLFLDPDSLPEKHRLMAVLTCPVERIRERANALAQQVQAACSRWLDAGAQDDESQVGGGSLAGQSLPTVVVRLRSARLSAGELSKRLRLSEPPIFARVHEEAVLLDPRTLLPGDEEFILEALRKIGQSVASGE